MGKRKTIEVERIKEKINSMILNSPDDMIREREALANFLSVILHETGNYKGFNYLTKEMMEKSMYGKSTYTINYTEGNTTRIEKGDETRVFYF